ncbi:MAG: hypothetical protein IT561_17840 [Alphaproteobacteria bacterium]|nr:hypothetical protein [Alphaproteobacteria bacterium]
MSRTLQNALRAAAFLAATATAIGAFAATEARTAAGLGQGSLMDHFAEDIRALNPVGAAPRADLGFCKGAVVAVAYHVSATAAQVQQLHLAALRKYGAPMAAPIAVSHGAVPPLVYRMGDMTLTIEVAGDLVTTHHRRKSACSLRSS